VSTTADLDIDEESVETPLSVRAQQLAAARAAHPSTSDAGSQCGERHLALVRPIRPPTAPEAWSAGLWGSFA